MSARSRSYDAAREALYALVPRGVVLGLEPVRSALAALGNPQRCAPALHIAGTNGKGSVAAMVEHGLLAAGRRVGLYTSPHLHRFSERVRIDGRPADEAALAESAWTVLDAIERGTLARLTFFEATTVMAWLLFASAGVDTVVLEVGLGGRLDATNVCEPSATAITRIALDHEAMLGGTIASIASEKAGILKPGVACVLGPDLASGEAREVIERNAARVGAPLLDAPAFRVLARSPLGRLRVRIELGAEPVEADLSLPGEHQAGNAAVAAALLDLAGVSREQIRAGLEGARWPGRLERIGSMLFDAAHNPDGAAALATALASMPGEPSARALVMGVSSDKNWRAMLDTLAPYFPPQKRFFCAASLRRAEQPERLAHYAGGEACGSVGEAVARAKASVLPHGWVVVCGSIFVVAEARARELGIEQDPPVGM